MLQEISVIPLAFDTSLVVTSIVAVASIDFSSQVACER